MAISSWMLWGRSLRSSRPSRHRQDSEENCVQLDPSKGIKENVKDVLTKLCQRQGIPSVKKLAYLNAIVKLVSESGTQEDYGYTPDELFCCLRVGLVHEATQVRAAALRAIRYLLRKEQDVIAINKLHYPYLVARSVDINYRNEMERVQALRLVRRILALAPKQFSPALARSLISSTSNGIEEKDRVFRVFLATLCELGVLNSSLLISCGGVGVLTKAALNGGQSPAIIEAVMGVLLKFLGDPDTRNSVSLQCLAAPYCELHSHGSASLERCVTFYENREQKFTASKYALLSVLRSYSGVIQFCHPHDKSGLKALSDILYVEQLEVRGAVLELLYDLLDLPLPTWTDEPDVALAAVDPNRSRDSWRLSEGFVAAEAQSVLPTLSSHRPNITELHLAMLIYVLLECGLHRALVETIVTSDTFISVRAAVLLGAVMHLAHSLLPSEVCDLTPALPNLLEYASSGRHQALAAVAILTKMHTLMRKKPVPSSLFLDRILQAGSWLRPTLPRRQRPIYRTWLRRKSPTTSLLKDSHVLSSKDALIWNWPVIRSILRSREDALRVLDSDHRTFVKRLVRYFKPTSNSYCRVEISTNAAIARASTLAGCDLLNCLLEMHQTEGTRFLNELVGDIAEQITTIRSSQSAHDCLFSPRHVTTTCCQNYFLFLGQLSHSAKGTVILKGFNLLDKLQDLALATNHDCYVKLIVSSLDYSRDGPNRKVMSKIISEATLEATRLYSTQFLRLILRARISDACQWAMGLLADRLADTSKIVASVALEALHEASDDPEYLEMLAQQVKQHPIDWDKCLRLLGDRGYLLKIKLYSLRTLVNDLPSPTEELERWIKPGGFAERYVGVIESAIHDSMTHRKRGDNGSYLRRSNDTPCTPHDVLVPPHLIGQLVQHEIGIQLIQRRNVIQRFARILQRFRGEFATKEYETNNGQKHSKGSRSTMDDFCCFTSEGSSADEVTNEGNRLETIVDSEVMEIGEEERVAQKQDSPVEIRRKFSLDDSMRTTPEKSSWRGGESESKDEKDASPVSLHQKLLRVKSALWALGHAGCSASGIEQLNQHSIIDMITSIAETCPYYSLKATAVYSLSLIGTTRIGADVLTMFNWPCVRHKRGDLSPIIIPYVLSIPSPSPVLVLRHHRSLSDGKPELPESIAARTRNRSESAATDIEARKFISPERGETPSPGSSSQRLSQQDAEGYARLRNLQRHRRPSYSQSSLEMHSLDGRLSLQSLSEYESSRSLMTENTFSPTPPPIEDESENTLYMGICLPKQLETIFPTLPPSTAPTIMDESISSEIDTSEAEDDITSGSEYDVGGEHCRVCLICSRKRDAAESVEGDPKLRKEIMRYAQRLANPVWYRQSRQSLLRLRQKYPEEFQNVCLFSDVAARLSNASYRISARRFLQELFLDSPFDELYTEPLEILRPSEDDSKEEKADNNTPPVNEVTIDSESGSCAAVKGTRNKVNGRATRIKVQIERVPSFEDYEDEVAVDSNKAEETRCRSPEVLKIHERLTDEKIIAEILKPEEKLRLSKNSESKLVKVTNANTAIKLD